MRRGPDHAEAKRWMAVEDPREVVDVLLHLAEKEVPATSSREVR